MAAIGEMESRMPLVFSTHALQQMRERGVSEAEVRRAIDEGEVFPAKKKRKGYRLNLSFPNEWGGKPYTTKQVVPILAETPLQRIVVTVYTFYF